MKRILLVNKLHITPLMSDAPSLTGECQAIFETQRKRIHKIVSG